FTVPAAPWFTGTRVRPLRPGRYPVVVPCATTFEKPSGLCTDVGLEGYFELTGGGSGLCQTDANCAVLEASPGKGPPGTLLAVNGWAPLTGLNGGGFLQMAIEGHPPQSKLGSSLPPPIASMPFSVTAAPAWAGLPVIHPVTMPAKSGMGRFGGFRASTAGVQALFWSQPTTDTSQPPAFLVEQTTDGGRTWPAASLRCPVSGPCIGLGPQDNGRCMAVGEWQAIEISTDGGQSWTSPGWPGRLGACTTSELVGLDSNGMVAVDQMGAHTLT